MATTLEDISEWFDAGVENGATHLIVVCDCYDYEDYPVYVNPGESARERFEHYNGPNMQKVMEVYNLLGDKDKQLAEGRSYNFGDEEPAPKQYKKPPENVGDPILWAATQALQDALDSNGFEIKKKNKNGEILIDGALKNCLECNGTGISRKTDSGILQEKLCTSCSGHGCFTKEAKKVAETPEETKKETPKFGRKVKL